MIETMATAAESVARPQDVVVRRDVKQRRDWAKWGLGVYFAIFLFFLYIPMILMAILSFQGDTGQLTFPFRGPVSLDWWRTLWDTDLFNTIADDVSARDIQNQHGGQFFLAHGAATQVAGGGKYRRRIPDFRRDAEGVGTRCLSSH